MLIRLLLRRRPPSSFFSQRVTVFLPPSEVGARRRRVSALSSCCWRLAQQQLSVVLVGAGGIYRCLARLLHRPPTSSAVAPMLPTPHPCPSADNCADSARPALRPAPRCRRRQPSCCCGALFCCCAPSVLLLPRFDDLEFRLALRHLQSTTHATPSSVRQRALKANSSAQKVHRGTRSAPALRPRWPSACAVRAGTAPAPSTRPRQAP